jgi:hypothetical protein
MLKLPLEIFVYGMGMLARTMQGMQRLANEGIDTVISGSVQSPGDAPDGESGHNDDGTSPRGYDARRARAQSTHKEEGDMSRDYDRSKDRDYDRNRDRDYDRDRDSDRRSDRSRGRDLDCDKKSENLLRLYRYKILFIKRDYEWAFPEQEELVADDLRDTDFVAWKVAQFIQNLDTTAVPQKWKDKKYPPAAKGGDYIIGLPEDDKKYIRVYYEILDTYCREPFDYEGRQIEVLEQIRDNLKPLEKI